MKNLIILSLAFLISQGSVLAQFGCSCLPEGISFQDQVQVDSFHINYPGCTEIEGDVFINGYVYNLNGLMGLEAIGGYLEINTVLFPDLTGLDSLKTIGGSLSFFATDLVDMTGLGSLEMIGSDLTIGCFTHSAIWCNNYYLENLSGLQKLQSIGGTLTIQYCSSLTNIDALEGLTNVKVLYIKANPELNSISGLANLNPDSLISMTIAGNPSLNSCQVESLCSYLDDPVGEINIYDNGPGCDSPVELASGCDVDLSCLPYGNYWFRSQADINSFPQDFPDCHEIGGNIYIIGQDIANLEPLNRVNSINGSLLLGHEFFGGGNPILENLVGLENIDSIAGTLRIQFNPMLQNLSELQNLLLIGDGLELVGNSGLTSLSGLESLASIGTGIDISGNNRIKDLSGLENVINAGSQILIRLNDSLTSLSGLENISAGSITSLYIYFNDMLSECDVASICEYLAAPNGEINIESNASGCNSQEEVEAACLTEVPEQVVSRQSSVVSYPNPTQGIVDLQFTVYNLQKITLKIYDVQGREVAVVVDEKMSAGEHTVRWNAERLPAGIYFYRLTTDDCRLTTGKLVKY